MLFDNGIFLSTKKEAKEHGLDKKELKQLWNLLVESPKFTGMDVAKELRRNGYDGDLIFPTSFKEYVFEGYAVCTRPLS